MALIFFINCYVVLTALLNSVNIISNMYRMQHQCYSIEFSSVANLYSAVRRNRIRDAVKPPVYVAASLLKLAAA